MDALINNATRYFTNVMNELGQVTQHINGNGWAAISACLLICGWYFLKGTGIRAA